MLTNFKDEDFDTKIKNEDVSVIQFSAEWCGPCKALKPVMDKLSDEYKDKAVLLVNTASYCGFTKQYSDLQELWEKYSTKGLIVFGVPSNSFNQEMETNKEIKNFCEAKFGISFPMTEKVEVKGSNAHDFYKWANKNFGRDAIPKWNFHKIIIGKDGKIYDTFSSMTKPSSKKFVKVLEEALKK